MASVSNAATRDVSLVLSDMSGGMATAYPPHAINDTQVSDSLNVVFEKARVFKGSWACRDNYEPFI